MKVSTGTFCFKSYVIMCYSLVSVRDLFSPKTGGKEGERERESIKCTWSPKSKVNHSYTEQDLSGGIEMWQAGKTNSSAKTMIWQHDCQGQFN